MQKMSQSKKQFYVVPLFANSDQFKGELDRAYSPMCVLSSATREEVASKFISLCKEIDPSNLRVGTIRVYSTYEDYKAKEPNNDRLYLEDDFETLEYALKYLKENKYFIKAYVLTGKNPMNNLLDKIFGGESKASPTQQPLQ